MLSSLLKKSRLVAAGLAVVALLSACMSGPDVLGEWGVKVNLQSHIICLAVAEAGMVASHSLSVEEVRNPQNKGEFKYVLTEDTNPSDVKTFVFIPTEVNGMYAGQVTYGGSLYYVWYNELNQMAYTDETLTGEAEVVAHYTNVSIDNSGTTTTISGEPDDVRNFIVDLAPWVKKSQVCLRG